MGRVDEILFGLQADFEVVTYGRGPFWAYSDDAVRLLAERRRRL
jgi:hypothetical protein